MSELREDSIDADAAEYEAALGRESLLKERIVRILAVVSCAAAIVVGGYGAVNYVQQVDNGDAAKVAPSGFRLSDAQKDILREKYSDYFEDGRNISPAVLMEFVLDVERFANEEKTILFIDARAESAKSELMGLTAKSIELKQSFQGEQLYKKLHALLDNLIGSEHFTSEGASLMTNLLAKGGLDEGLGMGNCSAYAKAFGLVLYGTFFDEISRGEVEVSLEHLDMVNSNSTHTRVVLREGDEYHEFEFTMRPGFHRSSSREDFNPEGRTLLSFKDLYGALVGNYVSSRTGVGLDTGDPFVFPDPKRSERAPDEEKMSVGALIASVAGLKLDVSLEEVDLEGLRDLGDQFRKHRMRSMSVDDEILNWHLSRTFSNEDLRSSYVDFVSKIKSLIRRSDSELEGFEARRFKAYLLWAVAEYNESIELFGTAAGSLDNSDFELAQLFSGFDANELALGHYLNFLNAGVVNPESHSLAATNAARIFAAKGDFESAASVYISNFLNLEEIPDDLKALYAIDFYYLAYGEYLSFLKTGDVSYLEWALKDIEIGIGVNERDGRDVSKFLQLKRLIEAAGN